MPENFFEKLKRETAESEARTAKFEAQNGALGNARWSYDTGLSRAEAHNGRRFFFGKVDKENWHSVPPQGNLLTIAQARSGKGTCLIVPNLLYYRGSTLVIDPKGENAWLTGATRKGRGQHVHIVDPWDEVERWYASKVQPRWHHVTARFNPLSVLKPGDADFLDNLAFLAEASIITQSTKDPYFDDSARELWAGLMAFVVENPAYSDLASMGLARRLLMRPNDELQRTIGAALEMPGSAAALKLGQFKGFDKSAGMPGIVQSARVQTAFLDNEALASNMEASDFSFDELREGGKPTTIYLVLPPDKFDTYGRWLRLLVSVAIGAVQKGPLEKGREGEEDDRNWQVELEAELEAELGPVPEKENPSAGLVAPWLKPGVAPFGDTSVFSDGVGPDYGPPKSPIKKGLSWLRETVSGILPEDSYRPGRLSYADMDRNDAQREANKKAEEERAAAQRQRVEAQHERLMAERLKKKERLRREKLKWLGLYPDQATAERAARKEAVGLPTLFVLDEFGTIGKLSAVAKGFGIVAGMGMCMWAFVQDLNQLKRDYPDDWGTFVSNSSAVSCFGIMDEFTADYISKMLGKKTVRHTTTSRNKNTGKTTGTSENTKVDDKPDFGRMNEGLLTGMVKTYMGWDEEEKKKEDISGHGKSDSVTESESENTTEHVVAKELMSTDELRRMQGSCIVIGRDFPVWCTLVPYYADVNFSALVRPDPRYPKK
jgi:type IV secretory pathway TraG/TraD family ATPase VirD4